MRIGVRSPSSHSSLVIGGHSGTPPRPMSVMETRRQSAGGGGGGSGRSTPIIMTAPRPSSSFAPGPPPPSASTNPFSAHPHLPPHFHSPYRGGGGGGGRASPSPSMGHIRGVHSPLFDAAIGASPSPSPPPHHMRRYSHVPRTGTPGTARSSRSNPASREASRSPSPHRHQPVYRRASAFIPPSGGAGGGGGGLSGSASRINSSSPLYIPDRSPDMDIR